MVKLADSTVEKLSAMHLEADPSQDRIIVPSGHVEAFVEMGGSPTPLTKELRTAGVEVDCDYLSLNFGGPFAEIHGKRSLQILTTAGVEYTGSENYPPLANAFSLREAVAGIQKFLTANKLTIRQTFKPSGALIMPPQLRKLLMDDTRIREAFLQAGMEPVDKGSEGLQIKCNEEQLVDLVRFGLEFPGAGHFKAREPGAAAQHRS